LQQFTSKGHFFDTKLVLLNFNFHSMSSMLSAHADGFFTASDNISEGDPKTHPGLLTTLLLLPWRLKYQAAAPSIASIDQNARVSVLSCPRAS
jgi:hypothetical protein